MESQTKGSDKQGKNRKELRKRLQYVGKHDHVDSKFREFPHKQHKIYP